MGPHMSSRQHQRVEGICVVTDDIGWSVLSMGAFCCRNDVPGTCFLLLLLFFFFFFFCARTCTVQFCRSDNADATADVQ